MAATLRIARPVTDLAKSSAMYCDGLGFKVLGQFEDHEGFDGVMVGPEGADYHLEFTFCRTKPVAPTPTHEDLIVLYIPDEAEHQASCQRMIAVGFAEVSSFNPYWNRNGRTFEDHDGYRTVICNESS